MRPDILPDRAKFFPMTHSTGSIHEVRWNEIFPWLILAKAWRASLLVRVLVYAWVGLLLTQLGWQACDSVFSESPLKTSSNLIAQEIDSASYKTVRHEVRSNDPLNYWVWMQRPFQGEGPLVRGWKLLSDPVVRLFDSDASVRNCFLSLCKALWAIAVWGIFGSAIARMSAFYCTRQEVITPLAAGRAALTRWPSTAGAPLIVLLFALLLAVPLAIAGLLMRADLFAIIAGMLWVFALAWGLGLAIVLIALWFGWPLMWATVAVERSDAFDAASRTAAYVYQRPLRLAFYVLVAAVLGMIGQLIVSGFATVTNQLTDWAISWGAGNERIEALTTGSGDGINQPIFEGSGILAWRAIGFWKHMLTTLVASYPLAYLFSASVGVYLLLRLDVDDTEMNEIAIDPNEQSSTTDASVTDLGEEDREEAHS
jgi:hypothetical protein